MVSFIHWARCQVSPCDDLAGEEEEYDSYFAPYAIPLWEDRDDLDSQDDITKTSCTYFPYNGTLSSRQEEVCQEEDFANSHDPGEERAHKH